MEMSAPVPPSGPAMILPFGAKSAVRVGALEVVNAGDSKSGGTCAADCAIWPFVQASTSCRESRTASFSPATPNGMEEQRQT